MHHQLPQQDSTCGAQPPGGRCVSRGYSVTEQHRPGGRSNSCRVDQVLQRDWNSVEWTAPIPLHNLLFGAARIASSALFGDGQITVKLGVEAANPIQVGLNQFDR